MHGRQTGDEWWMIRDRLARTQCNTGLDFLIQEEHDNGRERDAMDAGRGSKRAISSRCAATVLSSSATFSKSLSAKLFSSASDRPSISLGSGMPAMNPTRVALRI